MKNIILTLAAAIFVLCSMAQDIKVMTFNIRLNIASDSLNAWPYRKDKVAEQVLYHKVQLLGVQEALFEQVSDLKERLPAFKMVGGGRDDGKEKGEASSIFFDTTVFQLLASQTFWLSEDPAAIGKKGWDAAYPRVVTWAKLKLRKSNNIFFAFNTHFDHMGQIARRESAKLILQKVRDIAGNLPVVFTGDFNATPNDEPVQLIVDTKNPLHLTDSKSLSITPHYGPAGTFTGFASKERDDLPIDYIFLKGKWKVKDHATISQSWNGRFASDHFSVVATISIN